MCTAFTRRQLLRIESWWCVSLLPARYEVLVHFFEKRKSMVTIQVKGGTPCGTDTLCRSCSSAQIIKGFSVSQEMFFCEYIYPKRQILFAVCECTMYEDKRLASKKEMEEIAWFLTTRKLGRSVGFVSAAKFQELKLEEEESSPISNKTDESTGDRASLPAFRRP